MIPRWERLALPLLLVLVPASIVGQETSAPKSPEQLVEEADALVEEGSQESVAAAIDKYREAADLWQGAGEAERAAEAHRGRGKALVRAGDFDAAVKAYEAGVELAVEAKAGSLELEITDDIGYAHYRAGRREAAVAILQRQAERARALGDRVREANALGNIGSVYNTWSEPQKALDFYRRALEIRREINDREHLGSTLSNLGLLYADLGEPERGLDLFEEALALHRTFGNAEGESATLRNMGSAFQDLGEFERATELYKRSLVVEDDAFGRMVAHDALGDMSRLEGRRAEAEEHFRRALAAAQELKRPVAEANLLVALATVTTDGEATAWELLDSATRIYRASERTAEVSVVERERAKLLRALGRYEEAQNHIEQAIAIREAIRAELIGSDLRASSFGYWRQLYEVWAGILVARHDREPMQGHDRLAFEAAERARARGLLEAAALAGGNDTSVLDPARRIQAAALNKQISFVQRRLRADTDPLPAAETEAEEARLTELVQQRAELEQEISRAAHDPTLLVGLDTVSLAGAQRILAQDAALLEYLTGEKGSFLFVVRSESLAVHRLPPEEEIESLVRDLRTNLQSPRQLGLAAYAESAHELFKQLVGPALADLEGVDLLIIAADGPLHQLPFEALLTAAPATTGFVDQPYLLRRFDISYTPSASVLALLDEAGASEGDATSVLVVAGPFASREAADNVEGRRDLVRSVFGPDGDWKPPPLVAARREAEGIGLALGEEQVQQLLDDEATEAGVKSHPTLTTARYLHFATHALVSQRDPALSAVVLALDPEDQEDGLLQVPEIEALDLTADLVVLSACQTALGREIRGEGMLGLTRAFLAAGARSLVASLWSVADESTAELMIGFYGELAAGADKAAALRRAKLKLIENETYAHPFYWAPFVLQGAAD